jgi:hypothetical protein
MIDWQQAATHVTALGIGPEDKLLLALFPPKDRKGKAGCIYIEVSPGSRWEPEQVQAQLERHPGYSLGAILNPGGTKDREIRYCRALFFEDDGDGSQEEKVEQWAAAGLPRPSAQLWTGGKSVHHYWLLEEPCTPTEFRRAQKRLFRHVQAALPNAEIDTALCNPARILRLAGGIHPETGEMSRMISAGGQRYSLEQLWNLTGPDSLPSAETLAAVRNHYTPSQLTSEPAAPKASAPAGELKPLPDWDTPEHKAFRQQQVENDRVNKPEVASFRDLPRSRQLAQVVSALPFCIERGPAKSGTYETAFKVLAAMVNAYGVNDALECAAVAGWSQANWDIVVQAHQIEENSGDRDGTGRVTIFHLFDSAEFNGWVRPWKITKSKDVEVVDEEELAEIRAIKRRHLGQWIDARASSFRLADALHSDVAELLSNRATAFPVSEVAMLPPFITAMSAVLGVRYRVQIKKGWTEPMVFWMGSVGPASSLKTPVANQMLYPLLASDARLQKAYKEALKAWKAGDREERGAPPPLPRKMVAGDATLEGLCAALENESNHGMVSHHDELVSFIASMDAYRGRSGPSKDRAHWLSMWSGQEINILRKGHDPIFIPETAVSLFGCVQQDKLQELLHGDDAAAKSGDGFWARFLWCVPCNPFPKMNRDETEINGELTELMLAMDSFAENSRVTVKLSEAAWELFAAQADQWSSEADRTYAAKSAFLGKMRGYAARFAGFLHALDYANRIKGGTGGVMNNIDREIPGGVMERALLLCQFFVNQFDVLAPQVGGNEDLPSWVVKVVELAQSREDGRVTASDLRSRKWGESTKERKGMLEALVKEYGMGRLVAAPRANQVWWELT